MFIVNKMPKSVSAEAYRSLRTSIKFSSIDNSVKTIVVTSSIPGEGKSTISGNLAFCLSQNGARVVLIDCDLRKPSLHRKFEVSNNKGLTDVLVNKYDIKDVLHPITSKMFLITTGTIPPNPAEVLGSKTMEQFIDEISINFDYVVMDTPPLLPVTDAQLLASKADASLLVVRARRTRSKMIKQAYEALTKVNANVIGSILNDSEQKINNKYYQYYGERRKKYLINN